MRTLIILTGLLLIAPFAGQLSAPIAMLELLLLPVLIGVGIGALVIGLRQRRALLLLPIHFVIFWFTVQLTMGVPYYVRREAQLVIDTAEAWRSAHGEYPETLNLKALDPNCITYSRTPTGGFVMTCQGVAFTHCTYESDKHAWYAWD